MSNKVFCGGLAWGTVDSGLATSMAVFGEVAEAKVVMDRETGRSRGFGFVTFASAEGAAQAIAAKELEIDGRPVRIDSANDRAGGGGGGGSRPAPRGDQGGRPSRDDDRGRDRDRGGRGGSGRSRDRY
jgi:RNA recognition motif-containing protein